MGVDGYVDGLRISSFDFVRCVAVSAQSSGMQRPAGGQWSLQSLCHRDLVMGQAQTQGGQTNLGAEENHLPPF